MENGTMLRVLENPTFDIKTGKLISHDGESFVEEFSILFDRGAVKQAKTQGDTAGGVAAKSGSEADVERGAVIPGLIRDVNNPQGFTPQQQNNMLVKQQEGVGGGNAAITGEGRLAALRSRTAGGIAPALAEAARSKGRTLATGALDVANRNAELQQQQKEQARQQLLGLYGTDTSGMWKGLGLQAEDLQNQLAAGRQGWGQNLEGALGTISGMGSAAGSLGLGRRH
jgi:hypothetical protein